LDEVRLNFTLDNTGEAPENVSFNASCDLPNWTLAASPAYVSLGPGESSTIALFIDIPQPSPAGQTASVRLEAVADSGANASAAVNGTVDTVHSINLVVFGPHEVVPGDNVTLNLAVVNGGNGPENATVVAATDSGWAITQFPDPFHIDAFTTSNTYVKVQVPDSKLPGGMAVNISFSISNSGGTFLGEQNYTLTVSRIYKVTITAAMSNIVFKEGRPLTVPLNIVNAGNVRVDGTLDLTGDTAYARLQGTNVSIAPFSNQTVNLILDGNPGNWSVLVSLLSEPALGRPQAVVGFEIRARPSGGQGPSVLLVLAIVVLAVLAVALVAVVLRRRRKLSGRPGGEASREGDG
jgi:uncharacterized membrane protein